MLILVLFVEFPTFSNHKITHNASYFSKMSWKGDAIPTANLTKIFENEGELRRKNKGIFCGMEKIGYLCTEIFEKFRC